MNRVISSQEEIEQVSRILCKDGNLLQNFNLFARVLEVSTGDTMDQWKLYRQGFITAFDMFRDVIYSWSGIKGDAATLSSLVDILSRNRFALAADSLAELEKLDRKTSQSVKPPSSQKALMDCTLKSSLHAAHTRNSGLQNTIPLYAVLAILAKDASVIDNLTLVAAQLNIVILDTEWGICCAEIAAGNLTISSAIRQILLEWKQFKSENANLNTLVNQLGNLGLKAAVGNLTALAKPGYNNAEINWTQPFDLEQNSLAFSVIDVVSNFIGREAEICALQNVFRDGKTEKVEISGFAGIGKTQLVRKFEGLLQTSDHAPVFFVWLNAKHPETFLSSLETVCLKLDISMSDFRTGKKLSLYNQLELIKKAFIQCKLFSKRQCVLVVDNMNKSTVGIYDALTDLLSAVRFTITISRIDDIFVGKGFAVFVIGAFDIKDSRAFLTNELGHMGDDELTKLCIHLKNFPLWLQQIAVYIKIQRNISWQGEDYGPTDYLKEAEKVSTIGLTEPLPFHEYEEIVLNIPIDICSNLTLYSTEKGLISPENEAFSRSLTGIIQNPNSEIDLPTNSASNSTDVAYQKVQKEASFSPNPGSFVAIYDFAGNATDHLSFLKGELLEIINDDDTDWWLARSPCTQQNGYIPSNYVKPKSFEAAPWYFGKIKNADAEKQLMLPEIEHGSFLVRESKSRKFGYNLSVRDGATVKKYRVCHLDEGGYFIPPRANICFRTLQELVEHYVNDADGLCVSLRKPCTQIEKPEPANFIKFSSGTRNKWEIDRSSLNFGKELGQGMFTDVREGLLNKSDHVAIKTVKKGVLSRKDFLANVLIRQKLKHPKLIELYGICSLKEPFIIVVELMRNGSLLEYLGGKGRKSTLPELLDMAIQIADGMAYLGSQNCVHGHLSAKNVLVGESNAVKISILSFPRLLDTKLVTLRIKCAALEAAKYRQFSSKSDVWSFGILLTQLVTHGGTLYPGMSSSEVLYQVERGYRMPCPPGCPDKLYEIMLKCWDADPMKRPSFEKLQKMLSELLQLHG